MRAILLVAAVVAGASCDVPAVSLACHSSSDCPHGASCSASVCIDDVNNNAEGEGDVAEGEGAEGEGNVAEGEGDVGEGEGDVGEGEGEGEGAEGEGGEGEGEGEGEGQRFRVQLDVTNATSEELVDFPLLVTLTNARVDYAQMQPLGQDLRFVDDAGGALSHEIDTFVAGGTSTVWVKTTLHAASVTTIFLEYGDATLLDASTHDVWSNGYVGVWHMGEAGAVEHDSAGDTAEDGTSVGAPVVVGDGAVGGALSFDGTDQSVDVGQPAAVDVHGEITMEAWIRMHSATSAGKPFARIISKWQGDHGGYGLFFGSTQSQLSLNTANGIRQDNIFANVAFPADTWLWLACTWAPQPGGMTALFNGNFLQATSQTSSIATADFARLGIGGDGTAGQFDGDIDEVRLSNVARSRAWLETQQASMLDQIIAYGSVDPL